MVRTAYVPSQHTTSRREFVRYFVDAYERGERYSEAVLRPEDFARMACTRDADCPDRSLLDVCAATLVALGVDTIKSK